MTDHTPTGDVSRLAQHWVSTFDDVEAMQRRHQRELIDGPLGAHRQATNQLEGALADEFGCRVGAVQLNRGGPCPDSPTGSCIYDTDADPCMDLCLFCHGPYEDK